MKKYIQRRLRTLTWAKVGKIDRCGNLNREVQDNLGNNKRHLRADVLSLLSSALRPRLLCCVMAFLMVVCCVPVYATDVNGPGEPSKPDVETEYTGQKDVDTSSDSLTITIPSSALSLDVGAGVYNGFAKSEPSVVNVKTDNEAGYSFSIKLKDEAGNSDLVNNEIAENNKITSIKAKTTEDNFKSSEENNIWGYQPSISNRQTNTDFLPAPTATDSLLDKTTSANNDTGKDYSFVIAAKIDESLFIGSYSNTFVFTASTNTFKEYNISYVLNSGSGVSSPQTGKTVEDKVKISSTYPTRNGYEFYGWCDRSTSSTSCSGHTYWPGDDYPYSGTLSVGSNNVTLYAMWDYPSYGLYYYNWFGDAPEYTSGKASSSYVNLSSMRPTRQGYSFLGWCDSYVYDSDTCSGKTYQPGSAYYFYQDGYYNYYPSFYALWQEKPLTCSDLSYGETGTVDGYNVRKMKDGKCWDSSDRATSVANRSIAASYCTSPYRLPSSSDYQGLMRAYAGSLSADKCEGNYKVSYTWSGSVFKNDWGTSRGGFVYFTSSNTTQYCNRGAYLVFKIYSSSLEIYNNTSWADTPEPACVRCVHN